MSGIIDLGRYAGKLSRVPSVSEGGCVFNRHTLRQFRRLSSIDQGVLSDGSRCIKLRPDVAENL